MKHKKLMSFFLIVAMILQLMVIQVVAADQTGHFTVVDPKAYKTKNTYTLTNTGSNEASSVKATVLVGAVSSSPYQQNVHYKVTPWPRYVYVDSSGNIFAEVHIDRIRPQETKVITVERDVLNGGVSYDKDIYQMGADYTEFKEGINNQQYLESGEKVETTAPEIAAKALDFDVSKTKVQLAKQIYDFVNLYIAYDTNPLYSNKGALSALKTARGVCDEYASLFTALCRALNLPARVATGFWIDEPLQSGVWNDISSKAHAWAEFYLPGVGWVPAEPTFMYTYNGVRTPNKDYFANLKSDEVHLLQGYEENKIKSEINISYSYYKATDIDIEFGEQSIMPVASLASTDAFSDISANWAKDYINQLYEKGILFAKQPGLYKPADNITRAEFAAYLVNALQLDPKTTGISFKDVKDSSDYASYIKTAAAYKLITGDQLGYYKPNDPITRQDAATIMKRAIEVLGADYAALLEPEFTDAAQVSPYAKDAVKLIYNMRIMTGKPGNLFEPKSLTTRAEVSKILDNFVKATE